MSDQTDHYSTKPTQIVIYTTEWCQDCRRTKIFMNSNNIPFLDIDVDSDNKAEAFVKDVNHGNRSVPTIIFPDGSIMVEPSNQELEQKLMSK
ncbi:MAG: glutaredoxin family protein [Anaerolineae bacterium]|nr:glutaredoxin family protein [Anaerolineae bacterium]